MPDQKEQNQSEGYIRVRRGDVDSICVYGVTEDELENLEKGSPSSLYLNFSLFLLSSAISFLMALIFTDIPSQKVYIVFLLLTIVGFILGFLLLILWYRDFRSSNSIFKRIRNRLKEDISPTQSDGDSIRPSIN